MTSVWQREVKTVPQKSKPNSEFAEYGWGQQECQTICPQSGSPLEGTQKTRGKILSALRLVGTRIQGDNRRQTYNEPESSDSGDIGEEKLEERTSKRITCLTGRRRMRYSSSEDGQVVKRTSISGCKKISLKWEGELNRH